MDKPPQNTNEFLNNQEKLNRLETEIETLRLRIGDAMRLKNETEMRRLLNERLSKIAEYKTLGGSNSRTLN